jgi:transcriptional regulator with XRE-family HTH domain
VDETLGTRLKRIRVGKGLSQMELAFLAGVTRETVSRIELGTSYPRSDTVRNLCEALGCSPNDLYAYTEGGNG